MKTFRRDFQKITDWFRSLHFWWKLFWVIIALMMLNTAYNKWLDATHEFRFNKYNSVEEATAELARLYPKGTPIKKFQEDMESAGYRCRSALTDNPGDKGKPETMYFMDCEWKYSFMHWRVWTAQAVYGVDKIIFKTTTGWGWEGL